MPQCIYCAKTETKTSFTSREHVIPALLGDFGNNTPTLIKSVCDICNNSFSKLETIFKEDSIEGIVLQMLNINGEDSVRIRGRYVDISTVYGFGDNFFDEVFPFFKATKDHSPELILIPQVKIKNYGKGYQVFKIDSLKEIRSRDNSKFKKYKSRFQSINKDKSEVSIYIPDDGKNTVSETIRILNDYGFRFDEKKRNYLPPNDRLTPSNIGLDFKWEFNDEHKRLIAKIAFNYFAFCCFETRTPKLINSNEFSDIKSYIIGENNTYGSNINLNTDTFHLKDEKEQGVKFLCNIITLALDEGCLVCEVSFIGIPNLYKIKLGLLPEMYKNKAFGVGHVFHPILNSIDNLGPIKSDLIGESPVFNLYSKPY